VRAWADALREGFREIGIDLSAEQVARCSRFREAILEWNGIAGLTAIVEGEEMAIKHFVDSGLCLHAVVPESGWGICDVGSGAGFPGVVLGILQPSARVTLIEASRKKAEFLKVALAAGGVEGRVLCCRGEDAARELDLREAFDLVVARAVAPMRVLAEYCLPLVRVGGWFVALKGPEAGEEVGEASRAVAVMGGCCEELIARDLPFGYGRRTLVKVRKVAMTPERYPRRAGMAEKRPL